MASLVTLICASLLLLSHLLVQVQLSEAHQMTDLVGDAPAPSPLPQSIDCVAACGGRCRLSQRPRLCKRACGSCCARCGCVPPGPYGNLEACPCYANLTTRDNIRKCP